MDKPWKVIFAFVAVFIAGAIFGGVFTLRTSGKRWAGPPAPKVRIEKRPATPGPGAAAGQASGTAPTMMRQFTQRLKLTPEQRKAISPILARAAEDWQRLRRENVENTTRVNERMYADVAAQLSPEQRAELEVMRKQMQERIRHARERAGVPPRNAKPMGEPPPEGPRE